MSLRDPEVNIPSVHSWKTHKRMEKLEELKKNLNVVLLIAQRMLTVRAYMEKRILAEGTGSSEKKARVVAAEVSLNILAPRPSLRALTYQGFSFSLSEPLTFHDRIAKLCHEKFDNVVADIPENLVGRKVIAGIVMETKTTKTFDVISIASGTRFIKGAALTTDGHVLVDSHAEILAARGMRKFLYYHLTKLSKGEKSTVLQRIEGEQAELAPDIQFHLYISTAPCGDGAIFTHSSGQSEEEHDDSHKPIFAKNKQGLLRTKLEQSEGMPPTKKVRESHQYQDMNNVRRGERLRVMSCSDKICKWNLLGMQGALLATQMKPVYFSSITLGTFYNHGHIARAMCCRLEKGCRVPSLPDGYKVNHPLLGAVSRKKNPRRSVEKSKKLCINWNSADECAELTNGTTGVPNISSGFAKHKGYSRLCKQGMLRSYENICRSAGLLELVKDDYLETKNVSKRYQRCKKSPI
ncbi:Double-stranded RNA-specific adenosine deaminase [Mizuhopecten yessoensis]|uniref:Double-stranded RNA-specific adenosine deaminase n=1 Tax=Mizuhopecten yessoensis TaxID=6573 RepID=A0A210PFH9_MIZYE|nr:Double-stranded RNA-specific adenosine deaminase [Mizuhopecten yessoensis]